MIRHTTVGDQKFETVDAPNQIFLISSFHLCAHSDTTLFFGFPYDSVTSNHIMNNNPQPFNYLP